MISIEGLTKKFGAKTVLKNINLKFDDGKVYGVVGENGAGKTTLFRCISGLDEYEGKIESNPQPLKNHLGLLLTEPFFFDKITGWEYLQLLCNARGLPQQDFETRNVFDLPLNQYASTYSTGMKKKLALTGILLQNNHHFVLDEPFNGVDIQSNILIAEIITKLRELNRTVIISSHIFSTLSDTCDAIHLLNNGELVRTVQRPDFAILELEMKEKALGSRIERLGLGK